MDGMSSGKPLNNPFGGLLEELLREPWALQGGRNCCGNNVLLINSPDKVNYKSFST